MIKKYYKSKFHDLLILLSTQSVNKNQLELKNNCEHTLKIIQRIDSVLYIVDKVFSEFHNKNCQPSSRVSTEQMQVP